MNNANKCVPALLVHGGAGAWNTTDFDEALRGVREAAELGLARLGERSTALDAVIAAVRVLEDAPIFNAGIGSVLTRDGRVEVDASVMEGTGRRFGAIAAVPNGYPGIDLARAVLDDGEHILMCGEAVWEFARARGFAPPPANRLITQRAQEKLRAEAQRRSQAKRGAPDPGTVGAVAIDAEGRVAVATSTGGTTYKRSGRIGDTPLVGCGSYADDNAGAASATGDGEAIARVIMTRHCIERIVAGDTANVAAQHAVDALAAIGGSGGIICCDRAGHLAAAHNSPFMAHAGGRVGTPIHASMQCAAGNTAPFDLTNP